MSKLEKELNGIGGFSNEEILSSELPTRSNEWDTEKNSPVSYDEKAPPYSPQWTWPNAESTVKNIPRPITLKRDHRY